MEYRQVGEDFFSQYDAIPMTFEVGSILEPQSDGLRGVALTERPVAPYRKDLGRYGGVSEATAKFPSPNWGVFLVSCQACKDSKTAARRR